MNAPLFFSRWIHRDPLQATTSKRSKTSGFSLVEVVLAIGVVSFAFVGVFGLLPTGLTVFRKAMDTSVGAQIFQKIVEDARETDFSALVDTAENGSGSILNFRAPLVSAPALRYFDEGGSEIVPAVSSGNGSGLSATQPQQIVYYVSTRIVPMSGLPVNGASNGEPFTERYLATVTVQIANNPGGATLSFDGNNLISQAPGITISTFSALLAKCD